MQTVFILVCIVAVSVGLIALVLNGVWWCLPLAVAFATMLAGLSVRRSP